MRKWTVGVATIMALLALGGATVLAGLEDPERSTKTKGATTITWDSDFADFDYTLGATVTMTVTWDVDAGAAAYDGFSVRRATPRSKKDPAACSLGSAVQDGNSVDVEIAFSALHLDKKNSVDIGNCHLKLYLMIDVDGDGLLDRRAGYGVNVHVEDPQ